MSGRAIGWHRVVTHFGHTIVPGPQVLRHRALAQAAQVQHARAHGRGCICEAGGRVTVCCRKPRRPHGMDEVVGGVAAVERAGQAGAVEHVEEDELTGAVVGGGAAGGGADFVTGGEERGNEGPADEVGSAGDQHLHVSGRHGLRTVTRQSR